jgi:hypothetical protein
MKIFRANCKYVTHHTTSDINQFGSRTRKTITLQLDCVEGEIDKKTIYSYPIEMISKVENLKSILGDKSILVDDVLLVIDEYF